MLFPSEEMISSVILLVIEGSNFYYEQYIHDN